jgi:uncharacterized LabA/DUF88 family protein
MKVSQKQQQKSLNQASLGGAVIAAVLAIFQQPNLAIASLSAATTLSLLSKRQTEEQVIRLTSSVLGQPQIQNSIETVATDVSSLSQRLDQLQAAMPSVDPDRKVATLQHLVPLNLKAQEFHNQFRSQEARISALEAQLQQLQQPVLTAQPQQPTKPKPRKRSESRGRVAIMIDGANLYFGAKTLELQIDYAKLLDLLKGENELAFARIYLATSDDQNQCGFLHHVQQSGFEVKSKALIRRRDGSSKGNLDGEIITDLMLGQEQFDTLVLVSGDSDFAYTLETLKQRQGVRVEVMGLRQNTSTALIEVADKFINLADIQNQVSRQYQTSSSVAA